MSKPTSKVKARPAVFTAPAMVIPAIRVAQPDGSVLIKPGRPMVVSDLISTASAARLLGISDRRVQYLCQIGNFKTASKPGGTVKSNWRIARHEVESRLGQSWADASATA